MQIKPPAFIIIPYQLLEDERIKPLEEKLYGIIYWLTRLKNEKCTAGNEALSKLIKTTPAVIKNSLTNLEKRGYIIRTFKDRNRRVRDEIIPLIDFYNAEAVNEVAVPARKETEIVKVEKPKEKGDGKEVNELIKMFEPVNPSFERLFAITPQRRAIERLVKKHSRIKVEGAIRAAIEAFGKPYAPTIITPIELERKLGNLVSYYKKRKEEPKLIRI